MTREQTNWETGNTERKTWDSSSFAQGKHISSPPAFPESCNWTTLSGTPLPHADQTSKCVTLSKVLKAAIQKIWLQNSLLTWNFSKLHQNLGEFYLGKREEKLLHFQCPLLYITGFNCVLTAADFFFSENLKYTEIGWTCQTVCFSSLKSKEDWPLTSSRPWSSPIIPVNKDAEYLWKP